jgi:E-phenylitaconyl-CoA hydratase
MALTYEKKGKIAYITINRPEAMNAMDPETYRALSQAWINVRDDPDVWVAIITGAGDKAFSAGADLKKTIGRPVEKWHFWQTQEEQILNRGLEVWKPIIAAVNGFCLAGGMTLLLATDIRIAAEHATFGLSEVMRGILPGNGGTQRTIRQLPYPVAMYFLLTGERMTAQEALRAGLINKVVPLSELMPEAERIANRICENAPLAVRAIKELAVKGQNLPIEYGLRLEQAIQP